MSKVPYTVNVDEYICSCLEYIRKMHETRDYSSLLAVVERIQMHANAMEAALSTYRDIRYDLGYKADNKEISDEDFRKKAKEIIEEMNK